MEGDDPEVLRAACAWAEAGASLALATVARAWGSAPRPPGSWAVIRGDGRLVGSVSGGCVEEDLIRRVRTGELGGPAPVTLTYGVSREDPARVGLPCGGTLEVVVEPAPDVGRLRELRDRLARGELLSRRVELASGATSLGPADPGEAARVEAGWLVTVHGPRWRLLLVGAGPIARHAAEMACTLDFRVSVCDPREEYAGGWTTPGVELTTAMPDDAVQGLPPDARSAVVTLAHDPRLDDLALVEALPSPAFYVGALGSRASQAKRRERLLALGLTVAAVGRLHGPVGLPIGSRTPAEIALAILAEMTAVRNGVCPWRADGGGAPGADGRP